MRQLITKNSVNDEWTPKCAPWYLSLSNHVLG